jgi:hypothetical protein
LVVAAVAVTVVAASAIAGPKDPIRGAAFEKLIAAQNLEFQDYLRTLLPEEAGFVVAGPLDPSFDAGSEHDTLYQLTRVVCPSAAYCDSSAYVFEKTYPAEIRDIKAVGWPKSHCYRGHCGRVAVLDFGGRNTPVLFLSFQQNRWLVWWRRVVLMGGADPGALKRFSESVVYHLCSSDRGAVPKDSSNPPSAADYGLPPELDLYPPRPDYVIQGYQNYKDYLDEYADIETYFADGILAFVPTDSLLGVLKIRTLTAEVLKTLEPGEYFYAVGLNGRIRFAYETPREEVERIEKETGKKMPRANHAFLFPGEPVLTAGAFFVGHDPDRKIVEVDTHSGHYFYSNITDTIRDDIARRSDDYLLTIGHFFNALDREGIPYDHILISKM